MHKYIASILKRGISYCTVRTYSIAPSSGDYNECAFSLQGLFARRRQLLLTEGPHLYYVDPVNKVLKGEIPWSFELRPEAKNFKTFFVHTVYNCSSDICLYLL